MRTKFWQNYFLGKGFRKTSTDLFLNLDVANGKGGVWGGIFHLLRCFLLAKFGRAFKIDDYLQFVELVHSSHIEQILFLIQLKHIGLRHQRAIP